MASHGRPSTVEFVKREGEMDQGAKDFIDRADRRRVSLRGFALNETRDSDVTVADLSYAGCQLCCDDPMQTGEIVELRVMKLGSVQAEIRWSADGRAGAEFIS